MFNIAKRKLHALSTRFSLFSRVYYFCFPDRFSKNLNHDLKNINTGVGEAGSSVQFRRGCKFLEFVIGVYLFGHVYDPSN